MFRTRALFTVLILVMLLTSLLGALPVGAQPPAPDDVAQQLTGDAVAPSRGVKPIDQPNAKEVQRIRARQAAIEAGDQTAAAQLALANDRVLVILVEFAGTDTFTWNPGDQWDPLGVSDPNEAVLDANGSVIVGDCSNIITETTTFTYSGPLHNQMPRPLSAADRSGDTIWTPDFTPGWFDAFMFGNGVEFDYQRVDGSVVHEEFFGQSVRQYFMDMSGGTYDIDGDVIGWVQVPHSTQYYDTDKCPGGRSDPTGTASIQRGGLTPGGGTTRTLVRDALDAVNAISNTIPGFDWANYDLDGDGIIDRLWIVHSGYGEEDSTVLLNRTAYGENAVWSHSSSVSPAYEVAPGIKAGPYIVMPENGGIGVFAHEYAHNLGAMDLYAYSLGETSAGFWALQADDWTGYPIGFEPPAVDPMHLDMWGWLNPLTINDPAQTYTFNLGQASAFPSPAPANTYRGAKIELPDGVKPLAVEPIGNFQWWGGKMDVANAMMTTNNPIAIPAGGATLTFDLAYDIEELWDFLWIQASADGGTTWTTLTNADTVCEHDPNWIGEDNGFPADMCAAGIGGFTGWNAEFPSYAPQTFDLAAFAGQNINLRWWYMTDWGTTYNGAFVDNIVVQAGASVLFSDNAEAGDANWTYAAPWRRNDGTLTFKQRFYLQWRNVSPTGGYDSALADPRWRFGPANTGMLVWYENEFFTDNEVFNYLPEFPSYGPKGRMLVIDSHSNPYRDPAMVAAGYNNEGGNVIHRSLMRDAPFSLLPSVPYTILPPYVTAPTDFPGRLAISEFHDAMGYYPGAELVSRGPGYNPPSLKWVTKQWDASAVMPAKAFYPLRAPGYMPNDELRFVCSPSSGRLACYWYGPATGLGYPGGTGNPGDNALQYGWHVQILSQTNAGATIKVWNAATEINAAATVNRPTVQTNQNLRYRFNLNQNVGQAGAFFACAPLDTTKVEFVAGSATSGAMPISSLCPDAAAALAETGSLDSVAVAENVPVLAVAWFQPVAVRGAASFDFMVKVKAAGGTLNQSVRVFDLMSATGWRKAFNAPTVTVNPIY